MFKKLEEEKRAILISLYQKYILNYKDPQINTLVEDITFDSIYPVYSKEYIFFTQEAKKMIKGKLLTKDAKEILKKLQRGSIKRSPIKN